MPKSKKPWYRVYKKRTPSKMKPTERFYHCPLCYGTCEVKMNRKGNIGKVHCYRCKEVFKSSIHRLSDPIDVYEEWKNSTTTSDDSGTPSLETTLKEEGDERVEQPVGAQGSKCGDDELED